MYLKSLEIQGFKSFPDKISLTFDKGLTAVVGPNGSGKSNIGDSVRWVLGEQSTKTLRGNKMEDVIFSGTVARKPMGFAAVTLNIDNSDRSVADMGEEISVTRKLYRSGDSEYIINGKQCRLRDINELPRSLEQKAVSAAIFLRRLPESQNSATKNLRRSESFRRRRRIC